MIGRLQFCAGGKGAVEEERLYGLPVLRTRVDPQGWLGARRLNRAGRRLSGQGAVRMLLPREFEDERWLEHSGLRRIDPAPFLQAQSHCLTVEALRRQDVDPRRATVALRGVRADRTMTRAAVRLCTQIRHLVIDVPQGGEQLANWLRWEFGVAVLPVQEPAQLAVQFQPAPASDRVQTLELYGRRPRLAGIQPVAPALLEEDRENLELLTLLWEWGKLGEQDLKFT